MSEPDHLCMQAFYDSANTCYATPRPRIACKKIGQTVCEHRTDDR